MLKKMAATFKEKKPPKEMKRIHFSKVSTVFASKNGPRLTALFSTSFY